MKKNKNNLERHQNEERLVSPITQRILAVNILALGFLIAGIFYLDEYKNNLINSEVIALTTQAEVVALVLAEEGIIEIQSGHYIITELGNRMIGRLTKTVGRRARLFDANGKLIKDTRHLGLLRRPLDSIDVKELPPPVSTDKLFKHLLGKFDQIIRRLTSVTGYPPYRENFRQNAKDYEEVLATLGGKTNSSKIRTLGHDQLLLSVAVPIWPNQTISHPQKPLSKTNINRHNENAGFQIAAPIFSLMLTNNSKKIDEKVYEWRRAILTVFGVALFLTGLLSIYLARTIAQPILRLAHAAENIRHDKWSRQPIPDMKSRKDEIGKLAFTLKDMTENLWAQINAIESFAADVAHEIKNPLTSLGSAVETLLRSKKNLPRKKIMNIMRDDIARIDRLITDISDASRLDAELSRSENKLVNIGPMLSTLADINNSSDQKRPEIKVKHANNITSNMCIIGVEGRLAQVFQNVVNNAISFSPKNGRIIITLTCEKAVLRVDIDDEGPGIPYGTELKIFDRFYSQRPNEEKFGTHSGLGLNISKQILEAHDGSITASNRKSKNNKIVGAKFTIRLPLI